MAGADASDGPCHVDILLGNLSLTQLSPEERNAVSLRLAATIAAQNGLPPRAVMSLGHHRGTVDLYEGSHLVKWATIGWFEATKVPGIKTMVASLVEYCDTPGIMVRVFDNPKVHSEIVKAVTYALGVTGTLGKTHRSIAGQLRVLSTNVVRATAVDGIPTTPVLFPPWQTEDSVAAFWGWLFILLTCCCPLMLLRGLWLCCCKLCGKGEYDSPPGEDESYEFDGH
jgi:hypothetical protein